MRFTIFNRLAALAFSLLLVVFAAQSTAEAAGKFAALTVDARTGKIIFDSDSNGLRHPASLTKMMTLYIVFEELKAKRITLSTRLRVSARASGMAPSKLGLKPGASITVQQAIYALVIKSANDVAATVAENLAGSESAFAVRMTKTARRIGMSRTNYANASGLPNPRQITTARDQATLGLRLMRDFPQYYPYFRATQFSFNGRVIKTHNRLLGRFEGTDGIKTGYINASGYNLVTSSRRGNKRLVGVVLGGKSGKSRDAYMMAMLTKAFPKAKDGKTVAAKAGSAEGVLDPLKSLKAEEQTPEPVPEPTTPQPDTQAMAEVAGNAAQETTEEDADEGEGTAETPNAPKTPKVVVAELNGNTQQIPEQTVQVPQQESQPPQKNLPFQVKKLASQADVEALSLSVSSNWAVEIGDFKSKRSAADVMTKMKSSEPGLIAGKDSKTIPVKRKGVVLYRLLVSGYDEMSAKRSCARAAKLGKDCAVISPNG